MNRPTRGRCRSGYFFSKSIFAGSLSESERPKSARRPSPWVEPVGPCNGAGPIGFPTFFASYLAGFTPEQRQIAVSPTGLPFARLSLAQQQAYLSFFLRPGASQLPSGEELAGSTLRVDYSLPGAFQWSRPETGWRRFLPPLVRERTREAALQAARRIDPQVAEDQITPTSLNLSFLYLPGGPNTGYMRIVQIGNSGWAD